MVDMAHFAGLVAAGLHPSPGAARPRGHLHHAQDPRRPARRRHPRRPPTSPRSSTPRCSPASRAARWSTSSRPRRWRSRSPPSRSSASARSAPSPAPGSSPTGCSADDCRAAGISVVTGGTDVHLVLVDLRDSRAGRPAGRGPAARDRHHRQPQRRARSTRARRWSPPASAHRHPGAGHPRLRRRRLHRGRRHHRRRRCGPTLERRRARPGCAARVTAPRRPPPALPGPDGDRPMTPRAPPAPTCPSTPTSSGATPSRSAPTTS